MDHAADNRTPKHIIRLRGPCELLWTRNGTQQAVVRVQIPCKIEPKLFEGDEIHLGDGFSLRRNFGKPTGLEPSQSVTLELAGFEFAERIVINRDSSNEVNVAIDGSTASAILSGRLQDSNQLEIEFRSLPAVVGEIQLVIEG